MWVDRLLARVGDDDPATRLAKLRAFELLLVLHLCCERWFYAQGHWDRVGSQPSLNAIATWALTLVALAPGLRRIALVGLALVQMSVLAASFPLSANHNYFILYLLLVLGFLGRSEDEQRLALGSIRLMTVALMFYAGLQKLIYGYYFHGEFLAYAMHNRPWFRPVLRELLSADELGRLVGRGAIGPYRFHSVLALAVSNGAWLTEILLAPLLVVRRTRSLGIVAALGFIVVTETIARELFFGALFVSALLLFVRGDLNRRLLPAFVAYYAWLLLVELGIAPGVTFH